MISDKTIDEVKQRIDIVEVVSDFVDLKRAGQNYKALSPFTEEKTPSFFVSPSKGIYKCFSTGKGGDAIDFIMQNDGSTYLEAIRYLAGKYGVEIEETEMSDEAKLVQDEREAILIVLNYAKNFFVETLNNHEEGKSIGMSYLRERGLNDKTIERFELGYSLDLWDALYKGAIEKEYSGELMGKAGLIIEKEDKKVYDRFRGRVMFPIHSLSGKAIAFGARALKTGKNIPKYINSPETEVYNKSKVLYGLYQARQEIRKVDNCYLVEGYMDVISLFQADICNVVASSGTSLTEEQIALISRYTNNITILYDGDPAGIQASIRGTDMILEKGLNVRIVIFPEGEDPDSYLRKVGSTAFNTYIEKQRSDFITFKARMFVDKMGDDPAAKADAIREIINTISLVPDPVKRAVYIKECSTLFNLDEGILVAEANKSLIMKRKSKKPDREHGEEIPPPDFLRQEESKLSVDEVIAVQERECLRLLVNFGHQPVDEDTYYYQYFFNETGDIEFSDHLVSEMLTLYRRAVDENLVPDFDYFARNGDGKLKDLTAELYFQKYTLSENWKLKFDITVLKEQEMLDVVFPRNIILLKYRKTKKMFEEEMNKLKNIKDPELEKTILDHCAEYKRYNTEYARELGIIVDG
ncbi:MAG: DNA primase [Cyclobacteriaceae bacterium]|nr:DNA primase [Cyclobacteriaceae bacterium]